MNVAALLGEVNSGAPLIVRNLVIGGIDCMEDVDLVFKIS